MIIDMIEQISCSVNSLLMDPFIMLNQLYERLTQEYVYEHDIGKSMRLMGLPWPMSVAAMALHDDYVLHRVGHERAMWLRNVLDHVHRNVGMYSLPFLTGFVYLLMV